MQGIAKIGIKVDRQFCRNKNTTIATNANAFNRVPTTSCIETLMIVTDSNGMM